MSRIFICSHVRALNLCTTCNDSVLTTRYSISARLSYDDASLAPASSFDQIGMSSVSRGSFFSRCGNQLCCQWPSLHSGRHALVGTAVMARYCGTLILTGTELVCNLWRPSNGTRSIFRFPQEVSDGWVDGAVVGSPRQRHRLGLTLWVLYLGQVVPMEKVGIRGLRSWSEATITGLAMSPTLPVCIYVVVRL
jgi:hypothetical protein